MKDYNKIICFDTETTGVHQTDEVLSLSIVNENNEVLFNELIKPMLHKTWKEAEKVNHISPIMVANKKPLLDHQKELVKIFNYADILIGYNIEFDIRLLIQSGIQLFISDDLFYNNGKKLIDVMKLFSNMLHINRNMKLIDCAKHFNYEWKGKAHDSLADALATMYCYKKIKEVS